CAVTAGDARRTGRGGVQTAGLAFGTAGTRVLVRRDAVGAGGGAAGAAGLAAGAVGTGVVRRRHCVVATRRCFGAHRERTAAERRRTVADGVGRLAGRRGVVAVDVRAGIAVGTAAGLEVLAGVAGH